MIRQISVYIILLFSTIVHAQTDSTLVVRDTLFEKDPSGLVRFYFDDHYYLVDKDCEFKSIERLSAFIVKKNVFHGEFKDFNPFGRLILTGYYNEGVKEGLFTAYHPNGTTKWTCTFKDDLPTGDWKYFYPDGKPMLIANYNSNTINLTDYWDRRGKHDVAEGKGLYELMMPFDFYNEFGYPYFIRKGKIKNGLPSGYWSTTVTDNKKARELFSEEVFNDQGIMTEGYNIFADKRMSIPFSILPADHFQTAEDMIYKGCTFDAYSGFNAYLGDKFNSMAPHTAKIDSTLQGTEHLFSFNISVDKDGMPTAIKLAKETQDEVINKWITTLMKAIPYFFPTIDAEGKPVEDQISVSGVLTIDIKTKSKFHSFNVER